MYKFKSKAAADVIMLAPNAERVLALIGKTPTDKGIVEVADLPAAIAALNHAVEAEEAKTHTAEQAAEPGEQPDDEEAPATPAEAVSLRQRAWPLVDMMKRSLAEHEPVVWGV